MLYITIPEKDKEWDDEKEIFVTLPEARLTMEHSLISISKWEAKYHKAFLSDKEKTNEELYYYLECMTLTQNIDPRVYRYIPADQMRLIEEYIKDDHTATHINTGIVPQDQPSKTKSGDVVTSELLYYYMIALQIPMTCEKWHLGRLIALINVCNEKNKELDPNYKNKKLNPAEQRAMAKTYHDVNEARRKAMKSKG